jgi:tuftelin-interacting protein 11
MEFWSSFLPPFIRDNLLDQLILPKVQKAVTDWNSENIKVSLQAIVFPWLPYIWFEVRGYCWWCPDED